MRVARRLSRATNDGRWLEEPRGHTCSAATGTRHRRLDPPSAKQPVRQLPVWTLHRLHIDRSHCHSSCMSSPAHPLVSGATAREHGSIERTSEVRRPEMPTTQQSCSEHRSCRRQPCCITHDEFRRWSPCPAPCRLRLYLAAIGITHDVPNACVYASRISLEPSRRELFRCVAYA